MAAVTSPRNRTGPDAVDTMSIVYTELWEKYWKLVEDLMGGTHQMRLAGERWLAKFEGEDDTQYTRRLSNSYLYEMYADTLESLIDKPFSKSVTINGTLPEPLEILEENVDMEGTTLSMFCAELMRYGLRHGLAGVLVDHPEVNEPQPLSIAQEKDRGLRPTFVLIRATDLLGFKYRKGKSGERELTQIRFKECVTEPLGTYGDQTVEYVRIINAPSGKSPGTWFLYKPGTKNSWEEVAHGTHTYPGIPFVPFYTEKLGFMKARPPLMKLVWLNLRHWSTSSDQNNILQYARIPLVFLSGITQEEKAKKFVFGPAQVIRSTSPDADGKFIEHSGKAIEAGERDLTKLEEQAETLGAEPLIERTNESTATGKGVNEKSRNSSIQRWIRDLEACIVSCYHMAAVWVKKEITDKEFGIDIFDDFTIAIRGSTDMQILQKMRDGGDIDQKTLLKGAKRRGLLSESDNIDDIVQTTKEEGPPLSELAPSPENPTPTKKPPVKK